MSVSEQIARLSGMSFEELRFRAAQKLRLQREKMTLGGETPRSLNWPDCWDVQRIPDSTLREAFSHDGIASAESLPAYFASRAAPLFFFCTADLERIRASYPRLFPERSAQICAEANALCEHRFRIFAYPEVSAGREIPWRRDLVHRQDSGLDHWSRISYLDFEKSGDSKIVWEPNRFQHFFTLGQAYVLTGEERYAGECLAQFEHWRANNPWRRGINWASSLEVAFRAWSWLWTLHLLAGSRALSGMRIARITTALAEHADSIAQNLSIYFSPNTHLLGEGFALFAIGLLLPELKGAGAWRDCGRTILAEEIERQVRPDGSHLEQSSYYHKYATDFFLCADILAKRNGCPFSASFRQRLEGMCEVILHTQLPGGLHPMTGDADGGRLLALGPWDPNDQRGTLSTAAVCFERSDFRAAAGQFSEETLWLLGADSAEKFASLAPTPRGGSRTFRDAGLVIQRTGSGGNERMLLFDAGPQGMGACGHGHADALQVMLSADGSDWLVDPGTFVYTSSRPWRDFFRSTRAHNTLTVDGLDQAEPVDFFKWRRIPQPRLELAVSSPHLDVAVGSHDGYLRLKNPVTHRRFVIFVKPDYWIVSDEVSGQGTHDLKFTWHFAPSVELSCDHGRWNARQSNRQFHLNPAGNVSLAVVRGEESPIQGWYSRDYGHREPASVLVASAHTELPARFHWLFYPPLEIAPILKECPGPGLRLAIEGGFGTDLVAVRGQELDPTTGELWSDAEVAFLRRNMNGVIERFVLVNGCCASSAGQALVRADSMLDELDVFRAGDALEINARPARGLVLFAPGISRVFCNGKIAAFSRSGDWIEIKGET